MKRSQALRSLSRDHHQALVVAQRLRRASDPHEGAAVFLEFWNRDGRRHFQIEEEVLLPLWAHLGRVNECAAARLSAEHLRIRSAAVAIEAGTAGLAEQHELADQLAAHVRFEERELFVSIEQDLDDDELGRLARAVVKAEQSA